jgi:hypothetical protein
MSYTLCRRSHAVRQIAKFDLGKHCGAGPAAQEIMVVQVGV